MKGLCALLLLVYLLACSEGLNDREERVYLASVPGWMFEELM